MRKYETYCKKRGNYLGNWVFVGWTSMEDDEKFCILTKERTAADGKTWIYKDYKWLDGTIDKYKFGAYVEEN